MQMKKSLAFLNVPYRSSIGTAMIFVLLLLLLERTEANAICVRPLSRAHNKELALAGRLLTFQFTILLVSLQELHMAQCDS